jgi:4-hydroxyphenylacetate 3-monooxygenase
VCASQRVPDYINRAIPAYAGGADFLAQQAPRFGENIRTYYAYAREHDLCLTHTLINPQANRAVGVARQADPFLAARVKEETDAGLVIKGARMLATLPMADEVMVFPSTLLKSTEEDTPYAFGFAIPNSTPGLTFICRESVDYGRSQYDQPLGARFLAWDVAVSAFGSRQVLYERFFFGDPVRMAGALFQNHDRTPYMQMVREFLKRSVRDAEVSSP